MFQLDYLPTLPLYWDFFLKKSRTITKMNNISLICKAPTLPEKASVRFKAVMDKARPLHHNQMQ